MITFIGEVSGEHRLDGKTIAHHGELIKFNFGNIIGNDGDTFLKIRTDRHALNYGIDVELVVTNIELLKVVK